MKVVVYLRVADEKMLQADGYEPATWVRDEIERALAKKRKSKEAQ